MLHWAAGRGLVEDVRTEIEAGANVNEVNHSGSPLHLAASSGYVPVVRLLLSAGADPNAIDRFGRTPLGFAVGAESLETVRALVEGGAEVDMPSQGWTPAVHAAIGARRGIAEYLILSGADLEARGDGRSVKEWLDVGGLPGAYPMPRPTAHDNGGPLLLQRVRAMMAEFASVEESAAHNARRTWIALVDLGDSEANDWVRRFAEIQAEPELLARVEERYLSGDELRRARLVRAAKVRIKERDARREERRRG